MLHKAYSWLRGWWRADLWRAGRDYWLAQTAGWGFLWLVNIIASSSAYGQFLPWATVEIFVCVWPSQCSPRTACAQRFAGDSG